ncbi:MAG TPA: secretion protein, partial [Mycobacterium sp.]|nr:secretion protein [Mycobacterium sp.]
MDKITYALPTILDAADQTLTHGIGLTDLCSDVERKTNALVADFQGVGADGFFLHQQELLRSLKHLAETVGLHGNAVHTVCEN